MIQESTPPKNYQVHMFIQCLHLRFNAYFTTLSSYTVFFVRSSKKCHVAKCDHSVPSWDNQSTGHGHAILGCHPLGCRPPGQ